MAEPRSEDAPPGEPPINRPEPPADYRTGPKKPPWDTRWVKGQASPNPSGRPSKKHLEALSATLEPLAAAFIAFDSRETGVVDRDGKPVTKGEAFLEMLYKRALTDNGAAKLYNQARKEAYEVQRQFNHATLEAAIFHRKKYLSTFRSLEQAGLPLPKVYPDPRDVIIRDNGIVDIVGPMDVEEHALMQRAVTSRDMFLAQIDSIVLECEQDRSWVLAARRILRRKIYRLNPYIPPRLRKRIPPLRDLTHLDDGSD